MKTEEKNIKKLPCSDYKLPKIITQCQKHYPKLTVPAPIKLLINGDCYDALDNYLGKWSALNGSILVTRNF